MSWLRRQSLTLRLAWWHAATVLVTIAALALFVREIVSQRLLQELDRQLRIDFDIIEAQIGESQGRLVWSLRGSHGEEGYARMAVWFEAWSEDGELLLRHWPVPETASHVRPGPPAWRQLRFYSAEVEPGLFARAMERPARFEHRDGVLRVFRDESGLRDTQLELAEVFLFGLPFAVVLAVAGGWLVPARGGLQHDAAAARWLFRRAAALRGGCVARAAGAAHGAEGGGRGRGPRLRRSGAAAREHRRDAGGSAAAAGSRRLAVVARARRRRPAAVDPRTGRLGWAHARCGRKLARARR